MGDDTKIIETSGGKVILKTLMTARDMRDIRSIMTNQITVDGSDLDNPKYQISGAVMDQMQDKALEILVLEFNDSKEDILNRMLELPANEYTKVIDEINLITKKYEEKKTN